MELALDLRIQIFFFTYTSRFSQILLAIAIGIKQIRFQQRFEDIFCLYISIFPGISGQLERRVSGREVYHRHPIYSGQFACCTVLEFRSTECKTIMHTVHSMSSSRIMFLKLYQSPCKAYLTERVLASVKILTCLNKKKKKIGALISLIKIKKLKTRGRETGLKLTGHRQIASPLALFLL